MKDTDGVVVQQSLAVVVGGDRRGAGPHCSALS